MCINQCVERVKNTGLHFMNFKSDNIKIYKRDLFLLNLRFCFNKL